MMIRRVNPMSAAKVSGALGVMLGLVIGACISLIALVAGGAMAVASDEPGSAGLGAMPGMLFGAGAIIVLPIFYGVFMFVVGAVQAFFYNIASKWTGGLEVDAS